jgi:hypothetical protein
MTRAARRILHTTGAVARTVPNLKNEAAVRAAKMWDFCRGRQTVVWLDNYYRHRYGSDPETNNMSLNISVFALLNVPSIAAFRGHYTLRQLIDRVPWHAGQLVKSRARLVADIAHMAAVRLDVSCIRVPLDVPRQGVRSLQWLPYMLSPLRVGNNSDLLQLVESLGALRLHTGKCLPQTVQGCWSVASKVLHLVSSIPLQSSLWRVGCTCRLPLPHTAPRFVGNRIIFCRSGCVPRRILRKCHHACLG